MPVIIHIMSLLSDLITLMFSPKLKFSKTMNTLISINTPTTLKRITTLAPSTKTLILISKKILTPLWLTPQLYLQVSTSEVISHLNSNQSARTIKLTLLLTLAWQEETPSTPRSRKMSNHSSLRLRNMTLRPEMVLNKTRRRCRSTRCPNLGKSANLKQHLRLNKLKLTLNSISSTREPSSELWLSSTRTSSRLSRKLKSTESSVSRLSWLSSAT